MIQSQSPRVEPTFGLGKRGRGCGAGLRCSGQLPAWVWGEMAGATVSSRDSSRLRRGDGAWTLLRSVPAARGLGTFIKAHV